MFSVKLLAAILIATVLAVCADDSSRLIVHQSPAYQIYNFDTTLKLSDLKSLLLAINGFSVDKEIKWTGLKSTKPTATPRVNILFLTESSLLEENKSENTVEIEQDSSINFDYLQRYFNSENNGIFVKFDSIPTKESLKSLKCDENLDSVFYLINADGTDNLVNFVNDVVQSVKESCSAGTDDLMVYILGTEKHLRVPRGVNDEKEGQSKILNLAVFYSDNYPVMFHLLFWTSLMIGLAVVAITCGMYNMDPGLDTVIYRLTSQRMKKDN